MIKYVNASAESHIKYTFSLLYIRHYEQKNVYVICHQSYLSQINTTQIAQIT